MNFETIYQEWGRYSLIEVMQTPFGEGYAGFYNDIIQWWFAPGNGYIAHAMGMLPMELAPPGGRIAIIGAGAGRQVQYARKMGSGFDRILAIEVEPGIVDAVRGSLADRFDHVYEDPRVELVVEEARGFMEATNQRFDLLYLPSVGGYPQMMLEPGNMTRTLEAYRMLGDRLKTKGILAIGYPTVLDPRRILTEQYIRTLESQDIGLYVRAFRNRGEVLILAAREAAYLPQPKEVEDFYLRPVRALFGSDFVPVFADLPEAVQKTWDGSTFKPIRDDQPFVAGNVQHIFSLEQVGKLFLLVGGLLIAFSAFLLFLLRNRGNPGIPDKSFVQIVLISLLVGANFLIVEHYLILILFKKLYIYRDALVLGAIGFLVVTGLGSSFITARLRPICQSPGAFFLLVLLYFHDALSPWACLALLAPVAFVTGSFFPALFEAAAKNPLGIFAADSIGAAIGSMTSFFIPIVFGFDWFFIFATVMFWITAFAVYRFFRHSNILPAAKAVGSN